jgi:hypothetical protein
LSLPIRRTDDCSTAISQGGGQGGIKGLKRVIITGEEPRGDVANMSGFNNRMASSVPILGPLFDKATAAAGAAVQPLVSEEARGQDVRPALR